MTHDVVTIAALATRAECAGGLFSQDTVAWFASLGVELKEETGKLFPVTDKARTVLDALTARSRELGVILRPGHRVASLERGPNLSRPGQTHSGL
ncbi:MAG: NAD(P)/FAD-dependent oxidoreductase [Nitrospira sp.]|nr:NAD(P)/FAD-dependent oxidoreductase [Nitrospira sp.]